MPSYHAYSHIQLATQFGRQIAWIATTATAKDSVRKPINTVLAKSVLQSASTDAQPAKSGGWIQQKLQEKQQQRLSRSDGTGFAKIGKPFARSQSKSSQKDDGTESETTLTPKTLKAKEKWQQSDVAMARLKERLNDPSLAGWQRRKIELKIKHPGEDWDPTKKIARSSMEKIRLLNAEFPDVWTMKRLSEQFRVSQESIRRILKSSFKPTDQQIEEREGRRNEQISIYKDAARKHRRSSKP
ncbi:Required for respiratory growth protein 9 mitochondrial [Dipsacomyces acuminosporus]|nr:Required for respiratory growth protein 9 mitochondrial [Dipsacomyces acuminosporus]